MLWIYFYLFNEERFLIKFKALWFWMGTGIAIFVTTWCNFYVCWIDLFLVKIKENIKFAVSMLIHYKQYIVKKSWNNISFNLFIHVACLKPRYQCLILSLWKKSFITLLQITFYQKHLILLILSHNCPFFIFLIGKD